HDDGHDEGYHDIPSQLAEPEYLRRHHVTGHHDIVAPSHGTGGAELVEGVELILYAGIPCHEQLRQICHPHDGTGQYDHPVHGVDVTDGDVFFQAQDLAGDDQQRLYHRKPGEDRTRNEVRREDGGVPSGDH